VSTVSHAIIFIYSFDHNFYLVLRRITEPLWRLTFWAFHLQGCNIICPIPPAPRIVKTKQTPPTEARNVHRLKLERNLLLSDLTNLCSHQTSPFTSYIHIHTLDYKEKSLTLL